MQSEHGAVGLRSDARRNRQLLIEAAGEVLREQGLDASLDEIARRAGVGNATLYRHFRSRVALCEAVFAEAGAQLEQINQRVLAIEDPWEALVAHVEECCTLLANDQGLCELIGQGMPTSPVLNELRARTDQVLQTLLERAQRSGVLRSDIVLTDVLFILGSLMRLIPAASAVAADSWRRHLAITLDGLRPRPESSPCTPLPRAPLTYEQLLELGEHFHSPGRVHGSRKRYESPRA